MGDLLSVSQPLAESEEEPNLNTCITAVIPVRGGSTRMPKKNSRPFANTSLLELKINICLALLNEGLIHDVIVNTDDEGMIQVASSYPKVKIHRREKYYASSECPAHLYFEHIAKVTISEHILVCQVTCPLITLESYRKTIQKYNENLRSNSHDKYDSIVSVSAVQDHMWLHGKPLNYTLDLSPNSQDLPPIKRITYGLNLLPRKVMIRNRNSIGSNPYLMELSDIEAVDIDTPLDFKFAEFLYRERAQCSTLDHISYICSNIDLSVTFYSDLFGFKELKRPENLPSNGVYLAHGNIEMHLIECSSGTSENTIAKLDPLLPHVNHICFSVSDLETIKTKAVDLGCEIRQFEFDHRRLFVYDPDQNPIEVIEDSHRALQNPIEVIGDIKQESEMNDDD
jgi:CMP-N-acetylneuraminic acid synthetase/catechol 2,3-dioxygenase-like lactoylglutathione lyase family enzyme